MECEEDRLSCHASRAAVVAIALAVPILLSGCSRNPQADRSKSATPRSESAVELTSSQLTTIKIEPAAMFAFPVEKDAVGSVSFPDDPALIQAESTLLAASATYDLSHRELDRVRSLGSANGIAQKELEQAISDEQTAAAALKAARDAVRALGMTDPKIDRIIKTGRIESPSGRGHMTKWVIVDVAESDSPSFRTGQPVEVRLPALPNRVFSGAVSEIYSIVDPNTHRVTLRAIVADPDGDLRPGMLADITVEVGKPEQSVGVPEDGVVREGDGSMTVWVTDDRRRFVQRTVTTGIREAGRVQILDGLKSGQLVVTEGALLLDNMLQAPSDDD